MKKKNFFKICHVAFFMWSFIFLSLLSDISIYPQEKSQTQETTSEENINYTRSEDLRLIGGYEISAASSAPGTAKEFIDLYFNWVLPLGFNKEMIKDKVKIKPWRLWSNLRLTALPQQNIENIGTIDGTYLSNKSSFNLNKICQACEFLVGCDYTVGFFSQKNEGPKLSLGFIAAFGASTMINSKNEFVPIYNISGQFKARYPGSGFTDNTKYVAFADLETNRFYHQYYLGIRLKAFNLKKGILIPKAQFDASYGVNDAASGGHGNFFYKSVLQFNGFINVEIVKIPVYFFGAVVLNMKKRSVQIPLFLDAAPEEVTLTSPEVLIIAKSENDLDFFRIGVGMNIFNLFAKIRSNE